MESIIANYDATFTGGVFISFGGGIRKCSSQSEKAFAFASLFYLNAGLPASSGGNRI